MSSDDDGRIRGVRSDRADKILLCVCDCCGQRARHTRQLAHYYVTGQQQQPAASSSSRRDDECPHGEKESKRKHSQFICTRLYIEEEKFQPSTYYTLELIIFRTACVHGGGSCPSRSGCHSVPRFQQQQDTVYATERWTER